MLEVVAKAQRGTAKPYHDDWWKQQVAGQRHQETRR